MWNRIVRTVLITLLALQGSVLTGCSLGYTEATLPNDPEEESAAELPEVRRGIEARVHLHSGEVVEGEVIRAAPEEISIGKPGNYGYQEATIAIDEIAKIEVLKSHEVFDALALVAAGAMVAVAFAAMAFAMAWQGQVWT